MTTDSTYDPKYWLAIGLVSGIGPAKVRMLIQYFGSIENAWFANESQLKAAGLDRRTVRNLLTKRLELDLDAELERMREAGVDIVAWPSSKYPRYLKEIPNPPPVIFVRGELLEIDQWAVAIVGTRRLTAYGRQVTRNIVEGLVRNHVTVVSGLARGIDGVAHKVALDAGGRTIAVLGCGLDRIYPPENRHLADRIVDGNGAIVSDYALGVPPEAKNFPPRNRIISGLSLGVVVIEAGSRSGALITSSFALEQDREVFAVPGNVTSPASMGTNKLIQKGAKLVRNVDDVLEELNLTMIPEQTAVQMVLPESAEETALLSQLSHQPIHIDALTRRVKLSSSVVSSTLSMMELKGMVQQVGGMNYVLAREPGPEYEIDDTVS